MAMFLEKMETQKAEESEKSMIQEMGKWHTDMM